MDNEDRSQLSTIHSQLNSVELRAGYKQTEVGVIPEDWNVVRLGAVLKIRHGKSQHEVICSNGKYPILATGGEIGRTDTPLYSKQSVMIGRKGTIDVPRYMGTPFWTVDTLFYSEISNNTEPKFIYYKFWMIDWYSYNEASGVPSLNAATIEKIPQAFPPTKTEQTAIANALSDADAWIQSLTRLIAKKRQIKQGAMQDLLSPWEKVNPAMDNGELKIDNEGHSQLSTIHSQLKPGWVVKRLGEIAHFINGRAYSLTEWETQGTPVIRLQNLTGRGEKYYYSNLRLPEKQYCVAGDLLFMWSATFGPVIWQGDKAIYHYHIWKIECKPIEANKMYLFYILDDLTERLKRSSSSGGTMLHVTKEKMESTEIILPGVDEQIEIATILSNMDTEITTLETKLTKAKQIKQGMMQNLLTGRIRLV